MGRVSYQDTSSNACDMSCAGNSAEMCGAADRNSIYSIATITNPISGYIGCYDDEIYSRDLPYGIQVNTNEQQKGTVANYKF